MQAIALMEDWEFADINPKAEPLFVAPDGRILRYALRPGQVVQDHNAPHSPVYIVVLKGHGIFAGAIHKIATSDRTVDVTVEQLQYSGRKIARLLSFHGS